MPKTKTVITKQNSTNLPTVFEPTKAMWKWLESAEKLGILASITDIAKDAKIDRNNWYQWLEKQGFVEWWDSMWKKHLRSQRWKLDAIGMKKAETDYQYWKDMQAITGNPIPDPAQQQQAPAGNQVNFFGMSEEQVRRALGKEEA